MFAKSTFLFTVGLALLLWSLALDTWRPGVIPLGGATLLAAVVMGGGVVLAILASLRPTVGVSPRRGWRAALFLAGGAAFAAIPAFVVLQARNRTPTPLQFVHLREGLPLGHGEVRRAPDNAIEVRTAHGLEVSVERSRYDLDVLPTAPQLDSAHALLVAVNQAAGAFRDYSSTRTQGGFVVSNNELGDDEGAALEHLINPDCLADGRVLDPHCPEALVYRHAGDGSKQLIGFMFMMPRGEHGPQVGGPLTKWHYHPETFFCMDSIGVPRAKLLPSGGCAPGLNRGPSSEMMHVWLVDNTYGVFSHMMGGSHLGHDTRAAEQAAPTMARPAASRAPEVHAH